ncbi:hypothetical protein ElyMa_007003500 [Elysia marginata]|uniref:Secreted protein n=1 Tax=Elysia marginata TaxID=1093978 RepID=A0AAV4JQ90_9GAST|nr:hypothetical protein ElyMa_007003500 [Elysia marginata]
MFAPIVVVVVAAAVVAATPVVAATAAVAAAAAAVVVVVGGGGGGERRRRGVIFLYTFKWTFCSNKTEDFKNSSNTSDETFLLDVTNYICVKSVTADPKTSSCRQSAP